VFPAAQLRGPGVMGDLLHPLSLDRRTDMPASSQRYVAFLRGVSPMNCKMPELKRAFELAGFEDVKTLLSSGNVVFSARPATEQALAKKAEAAMKKHLGSTFVTFIRSVDSLRELLESDPYAAFRPKPGAKRVVTFLQQAPKTKLKLPLELDGARIVCVKDREVFGDYVVSEKGPVFMTLLQKTFGKDITTRTWQTVEKVSK
jgi:uncharacterized protein (DUF1697 family)